MCVLWHAAEVKLLWTQLCMRMSKYIWTSMWNCFWNFLKFFQKLPSAYIFINYTNLSKFIKFVKILFSTPTWISSNYQTFLRFSEGPSTKFYKFFVKFTKFIHNLPKFLKHFLNDFKLLNFTENVTQFLRKVFANFKKIVHNF